MMQLQNKHFLYASVIVIALLFSPIYNQEAGYAHQRTSYSADLIYNGNHHKIIHPILNDRDQIYISLQDLTYIIPLKVNYNNDRLRIQNENYQMIYYDKKLQNSLRSKDLLISEYKIHSGIIYLPVEHIREFLKLNIDFHLDEKTKTISIMNEAEARKNKVDQTIGATIYVHQKNVPIEKYEPRSGLYLGGYVFQDEYIDASMHTFNELTNKKHASYFLYVGYGQPFPTEWAKEVVEAGAFPHIAWEPNDGLERVKDDEYMRQFAKDAKELGVPVLLRYASEMNGTWTAYSGHEDLYIEKWRLVYDVMKEEASNVMMLWNVFTMPENTINGFYPGDDYVDYVGVNIYNVMYHNNRLENRADFEDPLSLLNYVYNTYSARKSIVIGEFGATNYTIIDGKFHNDFAIEKISRMYKYLPTLYPRVKFIYYFNVNNLVNAPEGRKINNYAITENEQITNAYATYVESDYYLTEIKDSQHSEETFSYRDFFFYYKGELFVDKQFVEDYLGMTVEDVDGETYVVSYQGKQYRMAKENFTIDKAAFFEKRTIKGISLHEIIDKFDLNYEIKNNGNIHIFR